MTSADPRDHAMAAATSEVEVAEALSESVSADGATPKTPAQAASEPSAAEGAGGPAGDGISVRSLFWNSGLNYATFLVLSITGFVLTPVIMTHVGEDRFGLLKFAMALTGYTSVLDMGLGQATMKAISHHLHEDDKAGVTRLISSVFGFFAVVGGAVLLLGLALTPLVPGFFEKPLDPGQAAELRTVFALSVFSVALNFPQSVLTATLQGMRDYATQNLFVLGLTLGTFAATLVVLAQGGGIEAIAIVNTVGFLIQFAVKLIVVRARHGIAIRRSAMSRHHLQEIRDTAGSVFVINIAAKLIFDTDLVVVAAILGPEAVAAYTAALTIGTLFREVGGQLNVVTLTTAASLWSQRAQDRLGRLYLEAMRIIGLVMFPALAMTVLIGPHFLALWIPEKPEVTSAAATPLIALAAAMTAVALHTTSTQILIAADRHRLVAWVTAFEAIANLVLSIVFARLFGLVGVALGTLIPTVVAVVAVSVAAASRVLGLSVLTIVRPLLSPIVQAAVVTALGLAVFRPFVESLSMLPLILIAGGLYLVWLTANIFGPRESRATYLQVLPWR